MRRYGITLATALVIVYLVGYLSVRHSYAEVWERDGNTYVLVPSTVLYYMFRPVMYADSALTGMRFHIGPHS